MVTTNGAVVQTYTRKRAVGLHASFQDTWRLVATEAQHVALTFSRLCCGFSISVGEVSHPFPLGPNDLLISLELVAEIWALRGVAGPFEESRVTSALTLGFYHDFCRLLS